MKGSTLIIHGSPRPNGNSSYLARVAGSEITRNGSLIEEIVLQKMKIEPCRACESCRNKKNKYCVITDDMKGLYERIIQCKAMILASPIYWFTMSAQMKLFIDRFYGLALEENNVLKDKRIGIILTYGDVDPYRSGAVNAIRTFEDAFKYTQSKIEGIVYGTAGDIGDAEKNEDLIEKAKALGKQLASQI
jgi:multimeric flavodoxin WrbA